MEDNVEWKKLIDKYVTDQRNLAAAKVNLRTFVLSFNLNILKDTYYLKFINLIVFNLKILNNVVNGLLNTSLMRTFVFLNNLR